MAGHTAPSNLSFSLAELQTCSGCKPWAEIMHGQTFLNLQGALREARRIWWQQVPVFGWLEAIQAHPRLGDKTAVQCKREASTTDFQRETAAEQDQLLLAAEERTAMLQQWNKKFEAKFGHVFLLFAQGASLEQVLERIQLRFQNSPLAELQAAAQEEIKIIEDRLTKLLRSRQSTDALSIAIQRTGSLLKQLNPEAHGVGLLHADDDARPPVTCHVLDTTRGCPAANLAVALMRCEDGSRPEDGIWIVLNRVTTNADGRAHGLSHGLKLRPGLYRVAFDTERYYANAGLSYAFYPQPTIDFAILESTCREHFHIPLLLSPFSYSTYRGS